MSVQRRGRGSAGGGGKGKGAGDGWAGVVGALALEGGAAERLDALLDAVHIHVGAPAVYLYLSDTGGRRYHLERSLAADLPVAGDDEVSEGGVGTVAPTPPLELPRTSEWDAPRVAPSPAGMLWSVPLVLGERSVGLVQVGPLPGTTAPSDWQKRLDAITQPIAIVAERLVEEERLRRELIAYQSRESLGRRLQGSAMQVERHLTLLLAMAVSASHADGGFVAIVDRDTRLVEIAAEQGLPDGFSELVDLAPPTGLFDWSAAAGGALYVHDFEAAARAGLGSILAVPLLEGSQAIGIFALTSFGRGARMEVDALDLLGTFATQAQQALRNDILFRTFAEGYIDTVCGLAHSLDARRPDTHGHHEEVSRVAVDVARRLGLPEEEIEAIRLAGLIHDVGLAAVASGSEGFQSDYDHPTIGAGLVEHLQLHPGVAAGVAGHHEWYDGWGFPHSLRGEEIPRPARILGVAEFIAEMAAGDPVRAPWAAARVANEIRQRRGSQFDPLVADAALYLLESGYPLFTPGISNLSGE